MTQPLTAKGWEGVCQALSTRDTELRAQLFLLFPAPEEARTFLPSLKFVSAGVDWWAVRGLGSVGKDTNSSQRGKGTCRSPKWWCAVRQSKVTVNYHWQSLSNLFSKKASYKSDLETSLPRTSEDQAVAHTKRQSKRLSRINQQQTHRGWTELT